MRKKKFAKNGLVIASESQWTGEEPTWNDSEEWSDERKRKTFDRALNFYNYYLNTDDYFPIIEDYLKNNSSNSKKEIAFLKKAPRCIEVVTCGKIARMVNLGMPKHHNGVDYDAEISRLLNTIKSRSPIERKKVAKKNVVSVYDIMQTKIRDGVMVYLDEMLDEWILNTTSKISKINLVSLLKGVNAPISALGMVNNWILKQRDELVEARDKTDKDSVEGYSYLKKPAIKKRIALLDDLLSDLELYKSTKKAQRKPRVKKEKSAEKLVSKLKYMKSSPDYGVSSSSPLKIIGSKTTYLFNEKYRKLTVLIANGKDGLTVSGTTISNFDEKKSYSIKLRNPKKQLLDIINKTDRQINNIINTLTTKKTEAKGRTNDNTIILKSV